MASVRISLLALFCSQLIFQVALAGEAGSTTIRFATFNIAMGLKSEGELLTRLKSGSHEDLQKAAAVIQLVRPDVLLLNEFDYLSGVNAGSLFVTHYLEISQNGQDPITYDFSFTGPVNIGNPIEFTMLELAKEVIDSVGSKSKVTFLPLPQDDPLQRKPDISLAKKELGGWEPKVNLKEGLSYTIEYFDKLLKS